MPASMLGSIPTLHGEGRTSSDLAPCFCRSELTVSGSEAYLLEQMWDGTVWLAMMYIAFNVPFRAAGFTVDDWDEVDEDCVQASDDRVVAQDHCSLPKNMLAENLARPLRSIVDLIFLADIIFSMHTAFYQVSFS
eukprot:768104-Hanusia_phi.AAC.8